MVRNQEVSKFLRISSLSHLGSNKWWVEENSDKSNSHTPYTVKRISFIFFFPSTDSNEEIWREKLEGSHLFE